MTTKPTEDWEKFRTNAISRMFEGVDEYGIYPTTRFFAEIDAEVERIRTQAYTEGVMKALEVLEKLHGTKDNFFVDESCGHCDGHPPCEIEIGIEEARAAIKALLS